MVGHIDRKGCVTREFITLLGGAAAPGRLLRSRSSR
jgi:hypothetical protein